MKKNRLILCFCFSMLLLNTWGQSINDSNVRLRQYPNLSSLIVDVLQKNEPVKVYRKTNNQMIIGSDSYCWYYIKAKNNFGWVFGKYITKFDDKAISEQQYSDNFEFIDFDFSKNKFINIGNDGSINEIRNPHASSTSDKIAAWISPNDIRNSQGTALGSDLVIKYASGKTRILTSEKDKLNWYEGEVGYIKIDKSNRYLLIDEGTGHVRGLDIFDLQNYVVVASGSYTSSLGENIDDKSVFIVTNVSTAIGFQLANIALITDRIRNLIGEQMVNKPPRYDLTKEDWMNEYTTFYFGDLVKFTFETGKTEKMGRVLFYGDVE